MQWWRCRYYYLWNIISNFIYHIQQLTDLDGILAAGHIIILAIGADSRHLWILLAHRERICLPPADAGEAGRWGSSSSSSSSAQRPRRTIPAASSRPQGLGTDSEAPAGSRKRGRRPRQLVAAAVPARRQYREGAALLASCSSTTISSHGGRINVGAQLGA